jgi:hypothetical protein
MTELQASRTLVKSPPELWAECSDAAALARHLDRFGEIRITRLDPETAVAWEGERARGTVRIEPAGWGTKVILTAEPSAPPPAELEPDPVEIEAEPVGVVPDPVEVEAEPVEVAPEPVEVEAEPVEVAPEPVEVEAEAVEVAPDRVEVEAEAVDVTETARPRRFARLRAFFRGPEPAETQPAPVVAEEPAPAPAPTVDSAPAPAAEPVATETEAALAAALDSLGQAHHRPYSRA